MKTTKKPFGVDASPAKLRDPIIRGAGTTDTERHLARLAERSFLDLWSYPNPHRDQRINGAQTGDGKELCDLLVVCGRHILIFSEKYIQWPEAEDILISWGRWYKRAIKKSAEQLRGAERWITEFPDRVFIDKACITPLPIALPSQDERIIHRIVVARGAGKACIKYFGEGTGSLVVSPQIRGDEHWDSNLRPISPFAIGDIDPDGEYVHVFDDGSLDFVMHELDTITEFTDYLQRKEEFIRSGKLIGAHGEEDLVAHYALTMDEGGEHCFITRADESAHAILLEGGLHSYLL
jgi:hypothetical protein